jgi:hypothetical protein
MTTEPKKTGIYLDHAQITDLIAMAEQVNKIRDNAYSKHGVDILTNDVMSSLSMYEIIKDYDPDYNPNFHRNGEDGRSGSVLIERKCATKLPNKSGNISGAGWLFHAQETDKSSRYIFAIRNKNNSKIVRIYDIQSDQALAVVKGCLDAGRQEWINRGKPNHDAVTVPEKILSDLPLIKEMTIKDCIVRVL